jgi:hypothetical protein
MFNPEPTVQNYGAADRANPQTWSSISADAYRLASGRPSLCELSMYALNSDQAFMLQNTDYDATGGVEKFGRRVAKNLGPQPTFSRNHRSGSICSQLGKSLGALHFHKRLRRNTHMGSGVPGRKNWTPLAGGPAFELP